MLCFYELYKNVHNSYLVQGKMSDKYGHEHWLKWRKPIVNVVWSPNVVWASIWFWSRFLSSKLVTSGFNLFLFSKIFLSDCWQNSEKARPACASAVKLFLTLWEKKMEFRLFQFENRESYHSRPQRPIICSEICPQTLSVPRSEQFSESVSRGRLWAFRSR